MGYSNLNKVIKEKVLVVTVNKDAINILENYLGSKEYILVENIDILIVEMEKEVKEMTIIFDENIPSDIKQNMELLIDNLESVEGIYFVEIGGSEYFSNSLRVSNIEKLNETDIFDDYSQVLYEKEVNSGDINVIESNTTEVVLEGENKSVDFIEKDEITNKENKYLNDTESEFNRRIEEVKRSKNAEILNLSNSLNDCNEKLENSINELKIKEKEVIKLNSEIEIIKSNIDEGESKSSRELKLLNINYMKLEEDLKFMRKEFAEQHLSVEAQKKLIREKSNEINNLKKLMDDQEEKYEEMLNSLNSKIEERVEYEEYNNVKENLEDSLVQITSLKEQAFHLKINVRKEIEEKEILKEDLDRINMSYKELLNSGSNSVSILKDHELSDSLSTQIFYFKVLSTPPYFRSFTRNLSNILKRNGKQVTIILKEEDEISNVMFKEDYFDSDRKRKRKEIKRINSLSEIEETDNFVWLRPSNIMFEDCEEHLSQYDNIILIDYLPTFNVFLKGGNTVVVNTFNNVAEIDEMNLKGLMLYAGEDSIVDLRYDKRYDVGRTYLIRDLSTETKIMPWIKNYGIK